ncbi:MAG: hypothetical protein J5695_06785 [Bacteroidales bacterium]|nr:hypothetical protein [Bacteroidales bacterium]
MRTKVLFLIAAAALLVSCTKDPKESIEGIWGLTHYEQVASVGTDSYPFSFDCNPDAPGTTYDLKMVVTNKSGNDYLFDNYIWNGSSWSFMSQVEYHVKGNSISMDGSDLKATFKVTGDIFTVKSQFSEIEDGAFYGKTGTVTVNYTVNSIYKRLSE